AAGNGRLKGIRFATPIAAVDIPGRRPVEVPVGHLSDATFRQGLANLAPLGLSFESFCFHTQLQDVADVADAFPNLTIILNHMGGPLDLIPTLVKRAGKRNEFIAVWSK